MKYRPFCLAGIFVFSVSSLLAQTALVRHAPTINGTVDGSVRQMLGENATINSGGSVTADLVVPGTPTVKLNGTVNYGGTVDDTGSISPTSYNVTLNSGVSLRHVVRRTDPITLPTISAPSSPGGFARCLDQFRWPERRRLGHGAQSHAQQQRGAIRGSGRHLWKVHRQWRQWLYTWRCGGHRADRL